MSNQRPPAPTLGFIVLLLTLIGWASVPLFIRHFSGMIDVWTSNGWRYGFSALIWAPVLIVAALRKTNSESAGSAEGAMKRRGLPRGLWRAALVPGVMNALGQVCFAASFYCIEPALATFGLRTQLLFVAIGAWIMFPQERAIIRTPSYIIGAAVLVVGVGCVLFLTENHQTIINHDRATLVDHTAASSTNPLTVSAPTGETDQAMISAAAAPTKENRRVASPAPGIALAVTAGLLFACYGLSVRKYMHGINSIIAFAAICQYTALVMVGLMLVLGDHAGLLVLKMSGNQIIALLASAVIGIALGHVFYYISLARLGVAITAGVLQLQPFLVAIGSLALFGEILTTGQWTGGCIAVAGAVLMLTVQWRAGRSVEAKQPQLQPAR